MKLADLAHLARADVSGPGEVEIHAVTDLARAHPNALVMVTDLKRLSEAEASPAGALLVSATAPAVRKPALRAANPRAAFARALAAFAPSRRPSVGIHPTAVVAPDAHIGQKVTIGPYAVIESGVTIGDRAAILAGVTVGTGTRIGADSVLHPGVTIYPDSMLGERVVLHSGVVIGSDGFGYVAEDGVHLKIPHVGRVVIEDDVEIGANTTVDRATLGETRIGRGTKIDNLVQVGHNVSIGEHAIIVAQVGISGSATIGARAVVAGQVGVADHVTIGAGAIVVGQSGVSKDIPPGATVSGTFARDHREELRVMAALRRLPDLFARVAALEARGAGRQRPRGRARKPR